MYLIRLTGEQYYQCSNCSNPATMAYDNGKVTNYSGFVLYCDKCFLECNPEIEEIKLLQ